MRPHCVYRYWDAQGRLLYVGCAIDPDRRRRQHRWRSWSGDIAAEQVTWYPTRGLAFLAEWVAIDTEHPLHNRDRGLHTRSAHSPYSDETPIVA